MGDKDLCLLNTMIFEGPQSSGSSCQGGIYNRCPPAPPLAVERRVCHAGVWLCKKTSLAITSQPCAPCACSSAA